MDINTNSQITAQINQAIAQENYANAFNTRQTKTKNGLDDAQRNNFYEEEKKDHKQPKAAADPQDGLTLGKYDPQVTYQPK